MPEHSFDVPVDLPGKQVFDHLAEQTNLREWLPEKVRPGVPLGMGSDDARQRIEWTADDGERGGSISIADNGTSACVVRVEIHGEGVDDAALQRDLEKAVSELTQRVSSDRG
jgi:cytosine/adenosine deaminase-related metal-dependent hydrolase